MKKQVNRNRIGGVFIKGIRMSPIFVCLFSNFKQYNIKEGKNEGIQDKDKKVSGKSPEGNPH